MVDWNSWADIIMTEFAPDLSPWNMCRPPEAELEVYLEVASPQPAPGRASSCSLWKQQFLQELVFLNHFKNSDLI